MLLLWDAIRSDIAEVVRSLWRGRRFTGLAAGTFALGISVNIVVFSCFDRLLFRPLPYRSPQQLVQIHQATSQLDGRLVAALMPYEISQLLQRQAVSLSGLAWDEGLPEGIAPAPGQPVLWLSAVSPNMLDVLGVRPIVGRGFEFDDATPGGDIAVVLSHDTWRSRFGGGSAALSEQWRNGSRTFRVVGVLPPEFFLSSSLFVERRDGLFVRRRAAPMLNGSLTVAPVARLKPGVSQAAAKAELDTLVSAQQWESSLLQRLATTGGLRLTVKPIRSGISIMTGPYLWLVSAAVWVVLALTCVNLSTLLLMRSRSNEYGIAVRAALGGTPSRLVRISLLETLALCLIGSLVAWLACAWAAGALAAVLPATLRSFVTAPQDVRIIAVVLAVTIASAILTSLAPAWAARRVDVNVLLRGLDASRFTRRGFGLQSVLLAVEAACAVIVVVGTSISVPGFMTYLMRSPGIDPADLFVASVGRSDNTGESRSVATSARNIIEAMQRHPGIERFAVTTTVPPFVLPPEDSPFWRARGIDGKEWVIGSDTFLTLRTPMRTGRELLLEEVLSASAVAILNESGAHALWPGEAIASVVGRTILIGDRAHSIVGVAQDIRHRPGADAQPGVFLAITDPDAKVSKRRLTVLLRAKAGVVPDAALIQSRLNEHRPASAIAVTSVAESFGSVTERPRLLAVVFGTLGGIVLFLSAIGVYAVSTVEAVRRQREVVLRRALGASPARACAKVVASIGWPLVIGAVAGVFSIWIGTRSLENLVREFHDVNGWTYTVATLSVLGMGGVAIWGPTRRTLRVDPAQAFRQN